MRTVIISLLLSLVAAAAVAQTGSPAGSTPTTGMEKLKDFRVIEFRRYTIKEGEREHFARYFESYFPEAFEQLGAIAFGSFLERDKPQLFTWIRGFHDIDERPKINSAFYYGPLWKEYKSRINELIVDSDNVMLLQPFTPDRSVLVLPAVDVVKEPKGAQGVVVAEIFSVKPNSVNEFEKQAEPTFAKYRQAGAKEAGLLTTLDVTKISLNSRFVATALFLYG